MQARFELNEGLARLETILAEFPHDSAHWNEAQHRFQFVDRLLTECLGWERPDISVEEIDELGGKADYVLGKGLAVLEAKKEARFFGDLPGGRPNLARKLRPLVMASKELESAVLQVLPYCVMHGASIAIVCNGPQLVIFQALTPGTPPLDGECYFFNGFAQYVQHFPILWTLLSPEGVAENRAQRHLSLHRNARIPAKASESLPEPRRYRYRNDFQENLKTLSEFLLEEVEADPAVKPLFYRECYVPLEANNRHLLLSKSIIAGRYRRVQDNGSEPISAASLAEGNAPKDIISGIEQSVVGGGRPVVVVGDVGVGKTSFFENLYENLPQDAKADTYFIHVNLGIKANLTSDVRTYVLQEIPNALRDIYDVDIFENHFVSSIYHTELRSFDRSVHGQWKGVDDREYTKERIRFLADLVARGGNHLQASLGHLARGQRKQIILVMDNADQRTFEVQQEAFLIAQELAASRNVLVFVALRPSTFYQSKTTGALSGYQNKILTISPPPADEVLQRRLAFAVRVAEGKVAPVALDKIRLELGNVVSFMQVLLRSIRTSEPIRFFLGNITGGNTRVVIELITGFCGSPNVDSRKIVEIEQREGNYHVPLHEFTKHALLGEYAYFHAQSSLVACNIFDTSMADPREHFLSSLLIAYLSSNVGVRDNDGFLSGHSILREMRGHGFADDQSQYALRRLATTKMIETPHAHYREIAVSENELPQQFHFRSTSIGIYHIRYWAGSFAFLDATSTDTPIFHEPTRDLITKSASSFNIAERFRKADAFRRYLEQMWVGANFQTNYYDYLTVLQGQGDTFSSVESFVARQQQRQAHSQVQRGRRW
jgi:predicted type IV restriction endonuclease/GTPase SAR1 family protein